MSLTRDLMCELRARLGASAAMPPPPAPRHVEPLSVPRFPSLPEVTPLREERAQAVPAAELASPDVAVRRVSPLRSRPNAFAAEAARHTTALVGIGHVGTRYATDVVLQFQAELAVAHQAVDTVLPEDWAQSQGLLGLKSRVSDHREFLLRPDLGRRLDEPSLAVLRERAAKDIDIQPILADGLSAVACMGSGKRLLDAFIRECQSRGWSVGTPLCARFARVWLEDEIGQTVRAKVAAILLGERPGLGTGDGLSAYLVYDPKVGNTDGLRNMMSNIHERGTPPEQAAKRLALLAGAMLQQRRSGVSLDLSAIAAELGDAGTTGYRAAQERVRLVETQR
ncbi:MAG: ethanolamine ammonia-lyase subunit EutC [Myxococcota bacterium]|nr:ethanolamine ammonia-lyase subunit EutC [Myxococcota bacterium]